MRKFVAVVLLVTVGVAGYLWFGGDRFAFKPEMGDRRYFNLKQSTELQSTAGLRGESVRIRMESLLRSDSQGVMSDGSSLVASEALHTQLWEGDRLVLDTENVPEYQDRNRRISEALKSGITEHVASDGRVLDVTILEEEGLDELADYSRLPEPAVNTLLKGLSPMQAYQLELPTGNIRVGMTWETGARDVAGQSLPALRYEISHKDERAITVTFASAGQSDETDAEALQVEGFMELERQAGWPIRAGLLIRGELTYADEQLEINSLHTLEQADLESPFKADQLWSRAYGALHAFEVETSAPEFETYFLPPFGPASPEESFKRLDESLLWFGTDEIEGRLGLDFKLEPFDFGTVEFGPVTDLRLLDAEGAPVIDEVPADPRYVLYSPDWAMSEQGGRPIPFIASKLTPEEREAIETVELDAEVTVPGELHSIELTPDAPEKRIEELGLTLSVDDWSSNKLRVRAQRPGGDLPESYPLMAAYPLDSEGEFPPVFSKRLSHTALEPLRDSFQENASGDPWDMAEQFAKKATDSILAKPMQDRYGDWLFDLEIPDRHDIKAVKIYAYGTENRKRTFSAPSAITTLQGGPVVGERVLEEHRVPELDFEKFKIDEIVLEGIEYNRLNLEESGPFSGRCRLSLVDEPTYQGSPVRFDPSGRVLTTEHGLSFFYDLKVDVNMSCVTDVVMDTRPVPNNGHLDQLNTSTIKLSNTKVESLWNIRNLAYLRQLPVIAYNEEGEALEPLSPEYSSNTREGWPSDGLELRFWGEIAKIHYPVKVERESRQVPIQFAPLP